MCHSPLGSPGGSCRTTRYVPTWLPPNHSSLTNEVIDAATSGGSTRVLPHPSRHVYRRTPDPSGHEPQNATPRRCRRTAGALVRTRLPYPQRTAHVGGALRGAQHGLPPRLHHRPRRRTPHGPSTNACGPADPLRASARSPHRPVRRGATPPVHEDRTRAFDTPQGRNPHRLSGTPCVRSRRRPRRRRPSLDRGAAAR
ncbi:unannotated protein [freshwater metagenome]|uniref:Unannotated protein n=1 Tax=freshwater metagenome TaxID=449393 RepID=A0A6J7R354_9ZZZZ